jgi:predicted transcriptional regulator
MAETNETNTLELATELTIAWLSNPNTRAPAEEVPAFLQRMHDAVKNLEEGGPSEQQAAPAQEFTPAVSVRKSLSSPDHIISMIDGKPYKSLKRHLSRHGLTPQQYRERYGLKADYPMVSENYSQVRRDMAKKIGLGRKAGEKASSGREKATTKPAGRRKLKVQFEGNGSGEAQA